VISPRLAIFLGKKGFSTLPRSSVNYIANIVIQVLNQRRQHLERRNDFIQMMVDREKEIDNEEQTNQPVDNNKSDKHQWGSLKKSRNYYSFLCIGIYFENFSFK